METLFERDFAPNEYLYHHLQAVADAVCMQFVIEGQGQLNPEKLVEAVNAATAASPGANLQIKGRHLTASGNSVPVHFEPNVVLDTFANAKLPQLHSKINIQNVPGAEIFVFGSTSITILIRVFHGVMDGKGALIWIENIFRALRGEPLTDAQSPITDVDLLKSLPTHHQSMNMAPRYKVGNFDHANAGAVQWHRFQLNGRHPSLLAKVASRIANASVDFHSRFMIPVDLRRHSPALMCTSNLTMPIFLEVEKSESWAILSGKIVTLLKNNAELNLSAANFPFLFYVPAFLLKIVLTGIIFLLRIRRRFVVTGVLSHLGKVSLAKVSGGGFHASAFCSLPVQVPFSPLSLVIVETDTHTELVFSTRQGFFTRNELEKFLP